MDDSRQIPALIEQPVDMNDLKPIQSDITIAYRSMNQSSDQPNSFYNYSISKSQIKPELYQLAFDVQIDDEQDWSTVSIDECAFNEPNRTIVTNDPNNGINNVNKDNIWITSAVKGTMSHCHPSSLINRMMNHTNGASVCCCCIM